MTNTSILYGRPIWIFLHDKHKYLVHMSSKSKLSDKHDYYQLQIISTVLLISNVY